MSVQKSKPGIPLAGLYGTWVLIYFLFLRPQILKWGTRLGESQRRLPGDDIIPKPNLQFTNAIDIDAPPEAVWPWIAQMGRERSGYYGLDVITNWGIPSVTFIRQDLDPPAVGDEMDGGYHIMELEPNRKLLYGGFSLRRLFGIAQDVTTLFLLERRPDGSTRLLVRRRAYTYGALGWLYNLGEEKVYFLAVREQLQTLKARAESMAHLHVTPQPQPETVRQ